MKGAEFRSPFFYMVIDQKNSVVLRQLRNDKKISKEKLQAESVLKNRNLILDLNRKQMRLGINANGDLFRPYSIPYWEFKRTLPTYKASDGIPDLFLRGHFQNNMNLTVSADQYKIDSNVPYAEKLNAKYNPIFGLSENYDKEAETKITIYYNKIYHQELNK